MKEVWKQINGYDGYYKVSNFGNIKRCANIIGRRKTREILMSTKPFNDGYCRVCLHKDNKQKMYLIHRLVGLHFVSNPKNKSQINHIDGNKSKNISTNLEWVTKLENQHHAINTGLQDFVGENSPVCILSEKQVLEIRAKHIPRIYSETILAKEYQTTRSNINNILSRRTWTHI